MLNDPWPEIRSAVAELSTHAGALRDLGGREAREVGVDDCAFVTDESESWTPPQEAIGGVDAPLRVVLMGRTMAGKSSLLSALSGANFDRIGDGRQRYSRDVFAATATASARIEVVDTPGVGAHDGAEDFEIALRAALDADLVVWVASSDSIQEDTARALRLIAVIGKPIIVALNCRQSLHGVGRLNLLKFPERVFGGRDGLVDVIRHHMAAAGVEPVAVVYVHALAASEAIAHGEVDPQLLAASRIEDLTAALISEHAAHSATRRALRVFDGPRRHAENLMGSFAHASGILNAQAEFDRKQNEDVHARLARVTRLAAESMAAEGTSVIDRRRDWHLSATEFGRSLEASWAQELGALQADVRNILDDGFSRLERSVGVTIADANAEWAGFSPERLPLRDLTGFDSVLGNRLGRAGIAALSIGASVAGGWAGAKLGAVIGAAVGGPAAPITATVGVLIGAGVGAALPPLTGLLKRLVDRAFLGEDGVLRKRRDELARQVDPLLDELRAEYEKAIEEQLAPLYESLAFARSQSDDRSAALAGLATRWARHREHLSDLILQLDKDTAVALLRIAGRERLARSVRRATRVPGVCILGEFDSVGFSEAWLYPPDVGEILAGGRPRDDGGRAASGASYALALTDAPVRLLGANPTSATICMR